MMRTAESVTEGHPDKVADIISDAILDAHLGYDPKARVAVETAVKNDAVLVFGEITSSATPDIFQVIRNTIEEIGYYYEPDITMNITNQSLDISGGIDRESLGAGDQGIVYGYATDETSDFMPKPIKIAHRLAQALADARKIDGAVFLRPDGKTQVSVAENGLVEDVVISAQHMADKDLGEVRDYLTDIVKRAIGDELAENAKIHANPAGRFVIGGPIADAGLTGRKIIVDTYGGEARHGGGAFSGKDATKVDRSGAYAARNAAKALVANNFAKRAEVSVAYVIGEEHPIHISVDTFGTGDAGAAERYVKGGWDFRPAAIIERFNLRNITYRETAAYGHFGGWTRPWEKVIS